MQPISAASIIASSANADEAARGSVRAAVTAALGAPTPGGSADVAPPKPPVDTSGETSNG